MVFSDSSFFYHVGRRPSAKHLLDGKSILRHTRTNLIEHNLQFFESGFFSLCSESFGLRFEFKVICHFVPPL
ncbi:hypothetical protein AYM40_25390 [Paraburkholderia phytofirmans OLGA172]|uniref:Uncharacterized protein n=1 Tax=Paraburkholderia phytofirmans OLGA172 TaxID=1417228 RepID=A0A160FS83_9BURK|nr:hypothetical protein AYM40_25390 [Paraburkholderia phytofirmans OLGA172]